MEGKALNLLFDEVSGAFTSSSRDERFRDCEGEEKRTRFQAHQLEKEKKMYQERKQSRPIFDGEPWRIHVIADWNITNMNLMILTHLTGQKCTSSWGNVQNQANLNQSVRPSPLLVRNRLGRQRETNMTIAKVNANIQKGSTGGRTQGLLRSNSLQQD